MKRIISVIFAVALIASFTACKPLPEGSFKEENTSSAYGADSNGETASPELEEFLNSFDSTDPAQFEQQFEQMLEEEVEIPEMEFGNELIDDSDSSKVEVDLNDEGRPDHSDLDLNFTDIFNNDEYTIDVVLMTKTAEEEVRVPVVAMRNGKQAYFEVVAPVQGKGSMRVNMLITEDGKLYFILPAMKAYMPMPGEAMNDVFNSEFVTEDTSASGTYIESREVVIDGKTYTCDIYQDGDTITKNYYNNEELKRIENISGENGENIVIMEINEISKKSDKSKFKLPKYFDLSTVMKSSSFNIDSMY
ncbi:MAG: hypothetical protein E7516_08235 [Ruminococcaceae bacterium]|nr:hypothetical protein [Oscillospiraceae bacterium]